MLKKFTPLIVSLIFFVIISSIWDYIRLPYDKNNPILGEYFEKKFNPANEVLRFILIIGIPTLIYLFIFLKEKTALSLKITSDKYFLKKNIFKDTDPLKKYSYLFLFFIFIEFLSIDFLRFVNQLDFFHLGTFLVPPINYLETKSLFLATRYDYGLISNNLGLIYNFLFGYYSPGAIIFIFLLLTFFVKFFLIIIIKKTVNLLPFSSRIKVIFFITLTLIAVSLPNYYDPTKYFSPRAFLYLFFLYFFGFEISKNNKNNYKFIFVGLFSLFSILWWYDIGLYTNSLILLSIFYLLINKEYKNISIILVSIFLCWLVFILWLPKAELIEFWSQFKYNFSESHQYLLGIEFKKPFSPNSGRWTKALLMILLTCIMLINFNFDKKLILDSRLKIFLNFFFLSGILIFNSALLRSDSYHLKYSSGIYTLIFIFLTFFFIIFKLKYKIDSYLIFPKFFNKIVKTFLLIILTLNFSGFFENNNQKNNLLKDLNIFNFKNNILNLVTAEDNSFLNDDMIVVIGKYKKISMSDNCVQILSDDVAFAYFLRKKTCTQFFISAQILTNNLEEKFISQLRLSNPSVILYESKVKILSNKLNMPLTTNYIQSNYILMESYKDYIFLKKND